MSLHLRILRPQGRNPLAIEALFTVAERRVTMTAYDVDESLRSGALRTTDLIELEGRWISLAEAIPFIDAAEVALRREQRRAFGVAAGRALLATLLTVIAFRLWLLIPVCGH